MLRISEIFYSIQGEGKFIGTPSVFIRTGGCNLSCAGFGVEGFKDGRRLVGCDTLYAANPAFKQEWKIYTQAQSLIDEILKVAQKANSAAPFDLVITGGEPSLHFANPVLLQTLDYFLKRHHKISIESNASVMFDFTPELCQAHFTLSVKLSNAKEKKAIHIPAIQNILNHAREVNFKFVLDAGLLRSQRAQEEIDHICSQICGSYEIYVMPQGSSTQELDLLMPDLVDLCLRCGYRLSDRLHLRIWGDKRGV